MSIRLADDTPRGLSAGPSTERYYVSGCSYPLNYVASHIDWRLALLSVVPPPAEAPADPQMQAPRYTYLPLLIPEIRENLVELALDEAQLGELDESGWWFEEERSEQKGGFAPQGPCKWCVRERMPPPSTLRDGFHDGSTADDRFESPTLHRSR